MKPIDTDAMTQRFHEFLASPKALEALTQELQGSTSAAQHALWDLKISTPKSSTDWQNSLAPWQGYRGEQWLFILPANHSVAGVVPMMLAQLAGISLRVRIPAGLSGPKGFVGVFLEFLTEATGREILTLSHEFRVGKTPMPEGVCRLFAYGSDETLEVLRASTELPVLGEGTGITASVLSELTPDHARALVKDAFSLGQQGCLSSRVALVLGGAGVDLSGFIKELRLGFQEFWGVPLPVPERVALDHETIRHWEQPQVHCYRQGLDEPLWVVHRAWPEGPLAELLSSRAFVLPILVCKDLDQVRLKLKSLKELHCVSLDPALYDAIRSTSPVRVCVLGTANQRPWL